MLYRGFFFLLLLCLSCRPACAAEPNQTFGTTTLLSGGVLSVNDSLFAGTSSGSAPDTLLGSLNQLGAIEFTNDNSSTEGNGYASALYFVPTNNGVVDFKVTGFTDVNFNGSHSEVGAYRVTIEVYNSAEVLISTIVQDDALTAGGVDRFTFNNSAWIGGDYDVIINNLLGGGGSFSGGDVDFFRFSGLTPGANFTATTSAPGGADTLLGYYSSTGVLLASHDDISATNLQSRVTSQVPATGRVYLAVSGHGDSAFGGAHGVAGNYTLSLALNGPLRGDYNNNGLVDAADYSVYRDGLGTTFTAAAYTTWRNNFGASAVIAAETVPEPQTLVMALLVGLGIFSLMLKTRHESGKIT